MALFPLFPCCEQRALSVISNNTDNGCNFCRRAHVQYQTFNKHTHTHTHSCSLCLPYTGRPTGSLRHVFWYSTSEWFWMPADSCRCLKRAEKAITGISTVYMLHRYTHMLPTPGVANVMALHWFCPTRWLVFIPFREECQGFSLLWCEKCVSFSARIKQILPHMICWLRRVYCLRNDFFNVSFYHTVSHICCHGTIHLYWSTLSGLTHGLIIRTRSLHPRRQDNVSDNVRWNYILGIS